MSFTCPRCQRVSHHPKDEEHRYCGACHEFFPDPEDKVAIVEMTEERQENFRNASEAIFELLDSVVDNPVEAYVLLQFMLDRLKQQYDIRHISTTHTKDTPPS